MMLSSMSHLHSVCVHWLCLLLVLLSPDMKVTMHADGRLHHNIALFRQTYIRLYTNYKLELYWQQL